MTKNLVMVNCLRVVAVLTGGIALAVGAPMCLMMGAMTFQNENAVSSRTVVLLAFLVLAAVTAGFVYAGVSGVRMMQSRRHRLIGAMLLGVSIVSFGIPMLDRGHPEVMPFAAPFFLMATLLFSAFVWPAWLKSSEPLAQLDLP